MKWSTAPLRSESTLQYINTRHEDAHTSPTSSFGQVFKKRRDEEIILLFKTRNLKFALSSCTQLRPKQIWCECRSKVLQAVPLALFQSWPARSSVWSSPPRIPQSPVTHANFPLSLNIFKLCSCRLLLAYGMFCVSQGKCASIVVYLRLSVEFVCNLAVSKFTFLFSFGHSVMSDGWAYIFFF